MLTHTDVDRFDVLVAEAVRTLRIGGWFVYVGVHPCFVNAHVEQLPEGTRQHPGYRDVGWQPPTPFLGGAVRARVGVHHLTLERLLTALTAPKTRIERLVERGGDAVPQFIEVRLRRTD